MERRRMIPTFIEFEYCSGGPVAVRPEEVKGLMPDMLRDDATVLFMSYGSRVHVKGVYDDTLDALLDALDGSVVQAKPPSGRPPGRGEPRCTQAGSPRQPRPQ